MNMLKDTLLHGVIPFVVFLAALFCLGMTVLAIVYVADIVLQHQQAMKICLTITLSKSPLSYAVI